jgi:hypothetical protein
MTEPKRLESSKAWRLGSWKFGKFMGWEVEKLGSCEVEERKF